MLSHKYFYIKQKKGIQSVFMPFGFLSYVYTKFNKNLWKAGMSLNVLFSEEIWESP